MLLLDTHVLVWTILNDPALGREAKFEIANALVESAVVISAVSFWELAMLAYRGRVTIHEAVTEWREKVLSLGIVEIPLTGDIAIAAVQFIDLHRDPGDRFIIATAIRHGAALVTADRRILDWPSPLRRIDARR
jgi:PIN domain nuclease of toxin-antitoxin system